MVMFGEEAHGSQAMMCETMSLTAVSIIIEKSFFEVEKMPLSGIKPLTTSFFNAHTLTTTLLTHLLCIALLTVIMNICISNFDPHVHVVNLQLIHMYM